jgi:hypothetical protein
MKMKAPPTRTYGTQQRKSLEESKLWDTAKEAIRGKFLA